MLSDSNYINRKVGTHKTQCVHTMRLRLFKPEFPIDNISVHKQIYPGNERVEDTDIFDSNIPREDEVDQNKNTRLDQDLVDNEPSVETVTRQLEPRRDRSPDRTHEILTRTDNPPVEIAFIDFRQLIVRFGRQEEIILPPPRDESYLSEPTNTNQKTRERKQQLRMEIG